MYMATVALRTCGVYHGLLSLKEQLIVNPPAQPIQKAKKLSAKTLLKKGLLDVIGSLGRSLAEFVDDCVADIERQWALDFYF